MCETHTLHSIFRKSKTATPKKHAPHACRKWQRIAIQTWKQARASPILPCPHANKNVTGMNQHFVTTKLTCGSAIHELRQMLYHISFTYTEVHHEKQRQARGLECLTCGYKTSVPRLVSAIARLRSSAAIISTGHEKLLACAPIIPTKPFLLWPLLLHCCPFSVFASSVRSWKNEQSGAEDAPNDIWGKLVL